MESQEIPLLGHGYGLTVSYSAGAEIQKVPKTYQEELNYPAAG